MELSAQIACAVRAAQPAFFPGSRARRSSLGAHFHRERPAVSLVSLLSYLSWHLMAVERRFGSGAKFRMDRAANLLWERSRKILPAKILRSMCSRAGVGLDRTFRGAGHRPGNIRGRDNPYPPTRA